MNNKGIDKVSLINDKGKHKVTYYVDNSYYKLTLADISEMRIEKADKIVKEINEIINANYTYEYLRKVREIILDGFIYMPYSYEAVDFALKILYKDERDLEEEKIDTILNIGCTASGKTTSIINTILKREYRKAFNPLISLKETTNFRIEYILNTIRSINNGFSIEVLIKDEETIKSNIEVNILEAIEEFYSIIYKDINGEEFNQLWEIAITNAYERLKNNREKTFDISYTYSFEDNKEKLKEKIQELVLELEKSYSESSSYKKCSINEIKEAMQQDAQNAQNAQQIIDLDNRLSKISQLQEYHNLVNEFVQELENKFAQFKDKYQIGDFNQKISIECSFENIDEAQELVGTIFGDKKRQKNKGYFTIGSLIQNAKIYLPSNPEINWSGALKIVDSLGVNQGDKSKDKKKGVFNRISTSVQDSKPDWIIYHTRLDAKDDYLQDIIRKLCDEGYQNQISIEYGRLDVILQDYCDEEDDLDEQNLDKIETEIFETYVNQEIMPVAHLIEKRLYLCEKRDKGTIERYKPVAIFNRILGNYKKTKERKEHRITEEQKNKFIMVCKKKNIFDRVEQKYINEVKESIPMSYQLLRWNVLECAIRRLYSNQWGYNMIYPAFWVKDCFTEEIACDEMKEALGDDYDEVIKEFLKEIAEISKLLLITTYKNRYRYLLEIRYNYAIRTMPYLTMTDERKYILRDMLNKGFKADNENVFRCLSECVLDRIKILK